MDDTQVINLVSLQRAALIAGLSEQQLLYLVGDGRLQQYVLEDQIAFRYRDVSVISKLEDLP